MPFDNICKLLAEKYPDRFAAWLLGVATDEVEVLKTELSIEPIRADAVTFLQTQGRILHLEFQVSVVTEPPLPLRMLDYFVRLHRRYRLPITQILVLLSPPSENTPVETQFFSENTLHEFQVVRLWEQSPGVLLEDPALLPLATLAATSNPRELLAQVARQVSKIESTEQRQEIVACTQLLAGLKFSKDIIRQLFKGEAMRESVIYQEILQEGLQQGERSLILRQLTRRFGAISPEIQSQIEALSLTQLEALGDALLDFGEMSDLFAWLQAQQPS